MPYSSEELGSKEKKEKEILTLVRGTGMNVSPLAKYLTRYSELKYEVLYLFDRWALRVSYTYYNSGGGCDGGLFV